MLGMGSLAGDVVAAYTVAGGRFVLSGSGASTMEVEDGLFAQARRAVAMADDVTVIASVVARRRQRMRGAAVSIIGDAVAANRRQISGAATDVRVLSTAGANLRSSAAAIDTVTIGGQAWLQYKRFALAPILRTVSVPDDMAARRAIDVASDDRAMTIPPDRAEIRLAAHRREQ